MSDQSKRWSTVAEVVQARMRMLGIGRAELRRRSGISDKTLLRYLAGEPIIREDKRYDLARALDWTPDSIDRILDGRDPIQAGPQDPGDDDLALALAYLASVVSEMEARITELEAENAQRSGGRDQPPGRSHR